MTQALPRADFARFLSACYYEPTRDFTDERLFESFESVAALLDSDLAEGVKRLAAGFSAVELQDLLVDYTRLFIGPPRPAASPYGTSWLSGDANVVVDHAHDVQEYYARGGFDMDEDFRDLPDHIAVELEFLYRVLFTRAQALDAGNDPQRTELDELHQGFLMNHVGKWAPRFAAAVRVHAATDFYRMLADLTIAFVGREFDAARICPPSPGASR